MKGTHAAIVVALVGVAAYVAFRLFSASSSGGGAGGGAGGGGSDNSNNWIRDILGTQPVGISSHGVSSPTAQGSTPYSDQMGAYTYHGGGGNTGLVATYIAPTGISNMVFPGPALPAPSYGIGLAPKAIIL
jgi:hypothetical protein